MPILFRNRVKIAVVNRQYVKNYLAKTTIFVDLQLGEYLFIGNIHDICISLNSIRWFKNNTRNRFWQVKWNSDKMAQALWIFKVIFAVLRMMKNIIFNKTESFIGRNTSDHACKMFCSKRNWNYVSLIFSSS